MQKIKFEKVKVRNFLSFGPDPIEFEYKNGLSFVTGYNKDQNSFNGVGKTTLLVESISFALFGETYRDINQSGIINENQKDECIVELWFDLNDDRYKIIRSLKPNKLYLYKNGIDITRTIPETNKDIINILGITKTIFNNTLVMTNDQKNRFLGQSKDQKTKFIEGILSLEVFSKMHEQAKKEFNEHQKVVDKSETVLEELKKSIVNDEKYYTEFNAKRALKISEIDNKIHEYQEVQPVDKSVEIAEIDTQITQIDSKILEQDQKLQKSDVKKAQLESQISGLEKEIKKFDQIQFNCPTCKRPMGDHDPDEILVEKNKIVGQLETVKSTLQKLNVLTTKVRNTVQTYKKERTELEQKIGVFKKEQELFSSIRTLIEQLENKKQEIINQVNPFEAKILDQKTKLDELQATHLGLEKQLRIKSGTKFVTSNQGVKSIIVKKILDTLNNRLAYYLQKLGSPHTCQFNEFFEEQILNKHGKEICYGNASGGEAKRIDFALLFAFRDIRRLQSNVEVNLTVLDELLDSGLDIRGQEEIQELLKNIAEESSECFYIITHRPDAIPLDANIIKLEKENGISKLLN
jgi:DNA repair exonuclease SbcCD ATPase subunit